MRCWGPRCIPLELRNSRRRRWRRCRPGASHERGEEEE